MSRRVVITGDGAVTPPGVGADALHAGWVAGRSGMEAGIGACSEFDPTSLMSAKDARRSDRVAQLAIAAAAESADDAGRELDSPPCDPASVGCVIGSGIGGTSTFEGSCETLRGRGPERVSPLSNSFGLGGHNAILCLAGAA